MSVAGTLTNNGGLTLQGNGDVATAGTFANNGDLYIGSGATLNVTNQFSVIDIPRGTPFSTSYDIFGTLNAGPNSAFANLTSVEGQLWLGDGQTENEHHA